MGVGWEFLGGALVWFPGDFGWIALDGVPVLSCLAELPQPTMHV